MATEESVMRRVRLELGDDGEPFRASFEGDGSTVSFDLPVQNVSPTGLRVFTIAGTAITDVADYVLDGRNGRLTVEEPFPAEVVLVVEGTAHSLFSDEELSIFIHESVLLHCNGREVTTRSRDEHGFIQYDDVPMTLDNLPAVEEVLVALLTATEALWTLSTDASTDIDVITSEGTHLPRSQRWAQLMRQIDVLEDKYQHLCQQLNVGIFRIEVSTLRRKSMRTGRLVPVFKDREYDDHTYPQRLLPPIDHRHDDTSGIPSPIAGGMG